MTNHIHIYVDADACPVKEDILDVTKLYPIDIFFIASYTHVSNSDDFRWVYVDAESEEVDMYIVNRAAPGDVVITQDYGLASLLSGRGVCVLSPRGKQYTEENMDRMLHERFLAAKARRTGARVKGPRKLTRHDRDCFRNALRRILSTNEGNRE